MAFDFDKFGEEEKKPATTGGFDFDKFGSPADAAVNDVRRQLEEPDTRHPLNRALSGVSEFFRSAALAPTKLAVGALGLNQQVQQGIAKIGGRELPKRGEGVISDVLIHSGEIGSELLRKQQQTNSAAKAGAVAGDIGVSALLAGGAGSAAGKGAIQSVKGGKILSAIGKGFVSGAQGGAAGSAIMSTSQGSKLKDVAGSAIAGGVAGGVAGAILGGVAATISKGAKTAGDAMSRYRLSQSRKLLEKGQADEILFGAGTKTDEVGTAVPLTPKETKALKLADTADLNPGDAGIVREANNEERRVMKRMFDLASKNLGKRAPVSRPIEEPGRYVLQQITKLDDLRQVAGEKLDDAINAMPDSPVDVSKARNFLSDALDDFGVQRMTPDESLAEIAGSVIDDTGAAKNVTGEFDFSQSRFKDNKSVQNQIASLMDDLSDETLTPKRIVNIRRRLFDLLELSKDQKDIAGPIEGLVGSVRDQIDEPLQVMSPEYAEAAQEYAMTRSALSDWYKKIGMKFTEGERPAGALKAGEISRRVLTNASGDYVDLFNETQKVFDHYGIKQTVDPQVLLRWNAALEDLFGTTQTQSLRGQVAGGVGDALNPAIDTATGGKTALLRKGAEMVSKATGHTKEAQREAMLQILNAFLKP